ncbi:hydantoinase/oxoprolinase family protein [Novosphingobium sp.]|uniref:hydantoinase/oxoprolinase family protein n=1 Tax=Novosphingobium sp. TaxID=1874826 RepID=UPI0038BBA2E0
MQKRICIDNGGTLTDICVFDQGKAWTAKTLTTPFDLSQCFFDGLRKISAEVYGAEDIERLLAETATIKYSTTQGTNSLVERKGPRLGLIVDRGFERKDFAAQGDHADLLDSLVGSRVVEMDMAGDPATVQRRVIECANLLAQSATSRIVVCFGGNDYAARERAFVAHYESAFPSHYLGTVPVAVSHESTGDPDEHRRMWSALLNGFLHPPMENFLFNAQKRLRNYRGAAALRIFRNDGGASKVSKTAAVKTYSSGPRGGMEAVRISARRCGFEHVVSVDVGGTTSDLGLVESGEILSTLRGRIEGVETSFEMCDLVSVGIGGGSVIRCDDGEIVVGPQSVGASPGPACFGLGGTQATITDALLVIGVIDPQSFFAGTMALDVERARAAIVAAVAEPLGISVTEAAYAMRRTWGLRLAEYICGFAKVDPETVLMAFGGAGPLIICEVAEKMGIRRIFVPRLAALFSAFGLSFSDIAQDYEVMLKGVDRAAYPSLVSALLARAERDMEAEGTELAHCEIHARAISGSEVQAIDLDRPSDWPAELDSVQVHVSAKTEGELAGIPIEPARSAAAAAGKRTLLSADGAEQTVPIFRLDDCPPGSGGSGPAVLEGRFFTGFLEANWSFAVLASGDVVLERKA